MAVVDDGAGVSGFLVANLPSTVNQSIWRLDGVGHAVQSISTGLSMQSLVTDMLLLTKASTSPSSHPDERSSGIHDGDALVLAHGGFDGKESTCSLLTRNGSFTQLFTVPVGVQLVQDRKDGQSVWVSDFGTSTVRQYSFSGQLLASYNTSSSIPMNYVRGLAQFTGPDYDLLVSDTTNRRLVRLSRDGQLVSVFKGTTGLEGVWGITIDERRHVFTTHCRYIAQIPFPDYCWLTERTEQLLPLREYHAGKGYAHPWFQLSKIDQRGVLYAVDINNDRIVRWNTTAPSSSYHSRLVSHPSNPPSLSQRHAQGVSEDRVDASGRAPVGTRSSEWGRRQYLHNDLALRLAKIKAGLVE